MIHVFRTGGIIPPIARDLHKEHIERVVTLALERANLQLQVSVPLCGFKLGGTEETGYQVL